MRMENIYRDIAQRTGGKLYIGIVGPVRTGKSTFIKKFMDNLVIPAINDPFLVERTRDELPQSGSGRSIMTAEPKFVPEEAVRIEFDKGLECSVRMIDCVGYMVKGAMGNIENGEERMVLTPWYDYEIPISQAAEEGTRRVIKEHSSVGIMVTTDGSVCDIPREEYISAEEKAVDELKASGKPFVIVLNCSDPGSEECQALSLALSQKYDCDCIAANCTQLDRHALNKIMCSILNGFPIIKYYVSIPEWLEALCDKNSLKKDLYGNILDACNQATKFGDRNLIVDNLNTYEEISSANMSGCDMAKGSINIKISMPGRLYYDTLSNESGFDIKNDRDLMYILSSLSGLKNEYERFHEALEEVESKGYGIVMPTAEEMKLEEPQVVRQGGRYGVKLKASAPSIHMIKTSIETEVSPAIGGERATEDMINFLIQGFDGDMSRIWESNIFGKSLNDIAGEALAGKIKALPHDTKAKLQNTIQRIVNEGSGGLICIIL